MQPILSSYREDHRCGGDWLASNGKVARCDPDSVLPCCSRTNWCGYISYQDCNCDSCVDYRIVRATYRDDNRCEGDWLAPNGNVAKCDIESYPCCTSDNWCSESVDDCRCEGCTDYRNVIEDIRLFGGLTPNVGRLEVKVYGEWGTVCDDSWELRDAAVVCRVLGFTAARTVRNHAYYGEGSGKIWYGDVECSGSEESLNDCPKSNVGVHNCLHSDDAGVVCTSYYTQSGPNPADLRYRKDNLCGYPWRAISGDVAECNPRGDNPCCGPNNQCGNTRQDCFCTDCIDYRDTI
ncbi:uncharacterized protein [Apostichopus japonicus]|uniref:uncharacterized protein n=1 Tax=Stichopus japonicus TaxID=307972 RepID=UPI003AB7422E